MTILTKQSLEELKKKARAATEMGHSEFPSFSDAVVLDLIARVEGLEAALEFYSDIRKWEIFTVEGGSILDSQDGDMCNAFEHDSETPWEIAKSAIERFGVK